MSDFNYPESKGPKPGESFEVSSFLNGESYKGMPVPVAGVKTVGGVSSNQVPLASLQNKEQSI